MTTLEPLRDMFGMDTGFGATRPAMREYVIRACTRVRSLEYARTVLQDREVAMRQMMTTFRQKLLNKLCASSDRPHVTT